MAKPLGRMNIHLKIEGQECKTGPIKKVGSSGRARINREGEYGQYTLYTCMKMKQ
jgi:hypothetical protein